MGYLEAGEGGREGRQEGSTDGRPRGGGEEGTEDRTQVLDPEIQVSSPRGERKSPEGPSPGQCLGASPEKRELRSPREGPERGPH